LAAAEGDGQGVGDVGGIGRLREFPLRLNGALDLGFSGVAIAGEGLLDSIGGEFFDADMAAAGDEEDDAAGVAHEDGGARVGVVGIKLLDGADFGGVLGEEGLELGFEFDEAIGDGGLDVETNHAAVDEAGAEGLVVDDAVAGELQAWVDADDEHGNRVAGLGGESRV